MKLIPLLYSTLMVQALLAGRKTKTRRVVTERNSTCTAKFSELNFDDVVKDSYPRSEEGYIKILRPHDQTRHRCFSKIKQGHVLWVRETFFDAKVYDDLPLFEGKPRFHYKADDSFIGEHKWTPNIHMPFYAARIFLKVKSVRVERLQDISEEDAIAEGITKYGPFGEFKGSKRKEGGGTPYYAFQKASRAFQDLWEDIHSEESWKQNPWVWVIEFERCEKPVFLSTANCQLSTI